MHSQIGGAAVQLFTVAAAGRFHHQGLCIHQCAVSGRHLADENLIEKLGRQCGLIGLSVHGFFKIGNLLG